MQYNFKLSVLVGVDDMLTAWCCKVFLSNFCNPRFLKPPNNLNQKLFPCIFLPSVKHCRFPPDFSNQFSFPINWKLENFTVSSKELAIKNPR